MTKSQQVTKIIKNIYDSYDVQAYDFSRDQVINKAIETYIGGLKFM